MHGQKKRFTWYQLWYSDVSQRHLLRWLFPLALAIIVCISLLLLISHRPYTTLLPAQTWLRHAEGTHNLEHTPWLEYAYTSGDASISLPEAGIGHFVATLHVGAPPGGQSVQGHLDAAVGQVDLGAVKAVRLYQLLVPAASSGHVKLGFLSEVQYVASDPRPLGLLLGPVAVQSLGPAWPAPSQVAAALLALGLVWLAIAQLPTDLPWKAGWLVLVAVVFAASHALTRGEAALQVWWVGLGLAAVLSMIVCREQVWPGQTSRWGVIALCLAWLIGLWVVAVGGIAWNRNIARQWRDFSFSFGAPSSDAASLVWRTALGWVQWDGVHYQAIAAAGYTFWDVRWPTIAFFPLYPVLTRAVLTVTGGSSTLAALLVAQLAFIAAVWLLYDLVRHDFGELIAFRAVVFLLAFPTAFFFIAGYSESLALLLAVAAVWAMRRRRWWLTGVVGGLLALTRVPGVLIAPVLMLAYLRHHHWRWQSLRVDLLAVLLPPLGLSLFLLYQWRVFGTPWAFLIAQESWQNGLAPPWQIPRLIVAAFAKPGGWQLASLQLGVWVVGLGLVLLALPRLPLEYSLTGLLLIAPAYSANIRDSLPRHVLISFPIFVVLAQAELPLWARWLIVTLLLPLLVLLTILFVNGFWIA